MKKILIYMLLLITFSELYSQGLYNNGAKILVSSDAYLNIVGSSGNILNTNNVTNGSVSLDGTIKVEGNITNNATAADVITSSTPTSSVILSGTTAQTLSGSSTVPFVFPNLTINNAAGVNLSKDVNVIGVFGLTSGLFNLGSNNLILGPTATIGGTPTATNMIVATGTGHVQKLLTGIGSFTFPIGDNNVTAKYSPVTLNFTSGTFATGAYAAVNVVNAAYSDPSIHVTYLKRYWNVSQSGITAFNANALFNYDPTDVIGTEGLIYGVRFLPTPVTIYTPTNATLHQFTTNGLTSLGTFTGAYLTKVINLSLLLEGLYNGAGTLRQARDAAGPHWPAGVADHITVELHDATTYATTVYAATDVPLTTTGTATLEIPAIYNSNYYLTVKHRNSIETTSATPLSFVGNTITQSYLTRANVYGNNLGLSLDAYYLIYGGDVNQDGLINSADFTPVINDNAIYSTGYLPSDVDGNGIVNSADYTIIINNNLFYVKTVHP
jgi:hypothetical protein